MPAAALAPAALWFSLQGWRRRLLFVTLFELSAIACTSWGLARMSGDAVAHAGVMGVASSAIAVLWNLLFNTLFERWEARQTVRGRSIARRMAHATCFEGGLVVTLVPLFAWWFQVGLWQALLMDLGLMAFFLAYTFGFNWAFDRVFGLPSSAS
jgi:uncharacterized membrane protein